MWCNKDQALEQNKSSTSSQNRARILRTASSVKDFAKLIVPVNGKPLFHLGDRRRRPRGADETLDKVFQGLLREANRELATLLRDVRDGSNAELLGGAFEIQSTAGSGTSVRVCWPLPARITL